MQYVVIKEINVLAHVPGAIFIVNNEKIITYANAFAKHLTGYPEKKLIGAPISKIGIDQELLTDLPSHQTKQVFGQPFQYHLTITKADSTPLSVILNGIWYHHESDEPLLYLCLTEYPENFEPKKMVDTVTTTRDHFYGLIGKTPPMQDLFSQIELAGDTGVNVIIQGESGTGKELVASAIHQISSRRNQPFIRVNCAALAETLLESELFGHVKGAFTGAYRDRKGTFETAHKGTILLDEIGEISPSMQAKLLRVLQERVIVRVGDNREIPVDVRIIAATNKHLRNQVKKGVFREDLFYRLNVFPIHLIPLSKRKADIPLLCMHFLKKSSLETGKTITALSSDTMRLLMGYCWPGNVRELENAIAHAFVLCRSDEIQVVDLPWELREKVVRDGICADSEAAINTTSISIPHYARRSSRRLTIAKKELEEELARHEGNRAATARTLGISTVALWKKMKKFGIN